MTRNQMIYRCESYETPDTEEKYDPGMIDLNEFTDRIEAMMWCWERMEEGFQTRMYRGVRNIDV